MKHHPSHPKRQRPSPSLWARPGAKAWISLVLVTGFYLMREHWGHITGWWPYLLLVAVSLMHLMHGHRGHQHGNSSESDSAQQDEKAKGQ
ncbi:MAG: DUF2933 domain-containing protein [Alcaligenaceae bacterium]|nr:DUF2933 domain-containing protein [Alcaligenaceae bacterium]